jgi:hypothetical protein
MNSQIPIDSLRQWFNTKSRLAMLGLLVLLLAVVVWQVMNQKPSTIMCELMDGYSIKTSEKHRILLAFSAAGLNDYEFDGDRILVPKTERAKYLNAVAQQNALPAMLADEDVKLNPFMPRSQQRLLENTRKKRQIREMAMQLPFVAEAWFEMDWTESNRVFQPDRNSAVIMIQPVDNQSLNRQQVATIKGMISGAIADLKPADIVVTDVSVGIAYQNLDDVRQGQLIDLVNWRISRQRHYRDRIESVLSDYEGIEIDVQILAGNPLNPQGNQVAGKSTPDSMPRRLPKPLARESEQIEKPRVAANSIASVPDGTPPETVHMATQAAYVQSLEDRPSKDPRKQIETENVAQLPSFQQEIDGTPLAPPVADQPEVVNVLVRVPACMIAKRLASMSTSANPVSQQKVIDQIKADIIARVQPLLPAASFAGSFPISVVIATDVTPVSTNNVLTADLSAAIVKYWPLLAVLLIGVLTIFWMRWHEKTELPLTHSTNQNSANAPDAETLRTQLSNLIDQDPATAAKVIKNWIRQAS